MPKLYSYRNKPGTILDAFDINDGEHLGTIMVVQLPPIFQEPAQAYDPKNVPIVVLKRALPIKHKSGRFPRGFVGLWSDCRVEKPE